MRSVLRAHQRLRAPPEAVPGPAQVDTGELKRVAITIARNAVPPSENAEAAARINIAAEAVQSDNADPLGLGHIDTRTLTLVRRAAGGGRASCTGGTRAQGRGLPGCRAWR